MDVTRVMNASKGRGFAGKRPLFLALLWAAFGCTPSGTSTVGVALSADGASGRNFVCTPQQGVGQLGCKSDEAFHTADHRFDLTAQIKEQCDFGIAQIWIETDKGGGVTRVQFQCAAAPIDEPPTEALPVETQPTSGSDEAQPAPQP